ncbi:hypothetical protein HDV00_006005 [Rhizophlyctis rosea]|nr:hypothetical protein HDV00_006005 [Rhizophlyctis rosea]
MIAYWQKQKAEVEVLRVRFAYTVEDGRVWIQKTKEWVREQMEKEGAVIPHRYAGDGESDRAKMYKEKAEGEKSERKRQERRTEL